MGIPKFYRWVSERYPLINQPVTLAGAPVCDNLYLDMNGVIHNCTHGNDDDITKVITEDQMMVKIFAYLDKLFQVMKPQQLLYMAIDGVAPRAKMNQQRSRRFRSAREAQEARDAALARGETLPSNPFDSNCITPGTPFMQRLTQHLKFFVRKKISEDPLWQGPQIILSGPEVPGEGEHKIMEYIRLQKLQPDWKPNQRHCMYGLDADLIMLALVTHEPHFCLLREVVSFTGGARGRPSREVLENPSEEGFVLLQVGLLRDYLDIEFRTKAWPYGYDLERVIDDFVFIAMLVGNDFIPTLPTLDIGEGALDTMFKMYKEAAPTSGGYLTDGEGHVHLDRFEVFIRRMGQLEREVLEDRAKDAEDFEEKRARREAKNPAWASTRVAAKKVMELDEEDAEKIAAEGAAALEGGGGDEAAAAAVAKVAEPPAGPTMMSSENRELLINGDPMGLQKWKERYYNTKVGYGRRDLEAAKAECIGKYVEGLCWVLQYYYHGVASWTWYYPFYFAPMASDLMNLKGYTIKFEQGKPFLPFEQLLSVLPAASSQHLPLPYRRLMEDPSSPVIDFYPVDFKVDMEGKRADWEGVVLVPFIEEERLLGAARSVAPTSRCPAGAGEGVVNRLSPNERARNTLGVIYVNDYDPKNVSDSYPSTLPNYFAGVFGTKSRCIEVPPPKDLPHDVPGFRARLEPGQKSGTGNPPGYPSLKSLSVTGRVAMAGVNVFGNASKKESVVVCLKDLTGMNVDAPAIAKMVLGQRCYIRWPYLCEAEVSGVSDGHVKVTAAGTSALAGEQGREWAQAAQKCQADLMMKGGIDPGKITILLHVRPCEGLVRQVDGSVQKRFAKAESDVPLQATLRRNPAPDPRLQEKGPGEEEAATKDYPAGTHALFLGRSHYGCMCTVLDGGGAKTLTVTVESPPGAAAAQGAALRIVSSVQGQYVRSGEIIKKLAIHPRALGQISGSCFFAYGPDRNDRIDVGLNIRSGARGLCVPDYTKPGPENKGWMYSFAALRLLEEYKRKHPWVFEIIKTESEDGKYIMPQLIPDKTQDEHLRMATAVRTWIDSTPLSKRPLVKVTAEVASEEAIRALEMSIPPPPEVVPKAELENVSPALLLKPIEAGQEQFALAGGIFSLGDRCVSISGGGKPPFGLRGTIVGVHGSNKEAVEVLFDSDFVGGQDLHGRITEKKGLMMPVSKLLNLSRPHAIGTKGSAPRVVPKKGKPGPTIWDNGEVNVADVVSGQAKAPDMPKKPGSARAKAAKQQQHPPLDPKVAQAQGANLMKLLGAGQVPPEGATVAPTPPRPQGLPPPTPDGEAAPQLVLMYQQVMLPPQAPGGPPQVVYQPVYYYAVQSAHGLMYVPAVPGHGMPVMASALAAMQQQMQQQQQEQEQAAPEGGPAEPQGADGGEEGDREGRDGKEKGAELMGILQAPGKAKGAELMSLIGNQPPPHNPRPGNKPVADLEKAAKAVEELSIRSNKLKEKMMKSAAPAPAAAAAGDDDLAKFWEGLSAKHGTELGPDVVPMAAGPAAPSPADLPAPKMGGAMAAGGGGGSGGGEGKAAAGGGKKRGGKGKGKGGEGGGGGGGGGAAAPPPAVAPPAVPPPAGGGGGGGGGGAPPGNMSAEQKAFWDMLQMAGGSK